MLLAFFPIYLVLIYCAGSLITNSFKSIEAQDEKIEFDQVYINFGLGFGLSLLLVHLISFLTQNITISIWIVLVGFIMASLIFRKKINKIRFESNNLITILVALILGACMGIRDLIFGNPDNFHIPLTASIAENNFYPPIYPSTHDMDMSSYHYGVDLIGAIFRKLFKLNIWETHSLQIFFCVTLSFLALYALINCFTKQAKLSIWLSLFATLYTSINSLDFLIREIPNLSKYQVVSFLGNWLLMSWTAVSHITSQLRLPSQNSAFIFAFILIVLVVNYLNNKDKNAQVNFLAIIICSFGIYFTFPAFYYPIIASVCLYLAWELLESYKNKKLNRKCKNIFYILICAYLGKILTFTGDPANLNGVKTLIFSPSFHWYHWGKIYIQYFYDKAYLSTLKAGFDYVSPAYHPSIPIFSTITLREFGFSGLIGLGLLSFQVIKRKVDASSLLLASGLISMMIPLLFEFLPRPIETTRFLHWTKTAFVIYLAIHLPLLFNSLLQLIQKQIKSKAIIQMCRFTLLLFIVLALVPGFISILPVQAFIFSGNNSLPLDQQKLILELSKIHESGDICLDNVEFKHGHNISELAGFFGVGGQIYKADELTRRSAIYILNPLLLQELKVDYILLSNNDRIADLGKTRLSNSKYFQELNNIKTISPNYHLYKFLAKDEPFTESERTSLETEYKWTIACDLAKKLNFIQNPNGGLVIFNNRKEAIKATDEYRNQIKKSNPICAFWLKEEAMSNVR